ncbi:MAG TPA: hypothetical protein P5295_15230 [Spirochaetota bacterium]|nr:hypothetical protein [Spirochaetota bacterium]
MKKGIAMSTLLSTLLSIIGCSEKSTQYKQAEVYKDLRKQVFSISPSDLKITRNESKIVYGVIMETGYPEAVVSLIAIGDGTVSLYFSNGGGIIGIGGHEKPKSICLDYINDSNNFIKLATKTDSNQLPNNGETIFYFLTFDGIYYFKEKEDTLGNNKSSFSKLFYKAQELITEARIIDEDRRKNKP